MIPWIAKRYLFSKNAGRYASWLCVTSIIGVAIGIFALVLVVSVMQGFRKEVTDKLLGFNAHITIVKKDGEKNLSIEEVNRLLEGARVRDVAPFVQGEVIAQTETGDEPLAIGARVRGIEAAKLGAMERVAFYFPEGGEGMASLGNSGAIIGSEIVAALSVYPDFDDKIELVAPLAELAPSGDLIPNKKSFHVSGVFRSGVFEYDSKYILVSIDEAKRLLGLQAEEGWQVRLVDLQDVEEVAALLSSKIPNGFKIESFNEQNRRLFAALKLERVAMISVLIMVLIIASFAIVGVVMLITAAKRRDVAILKTVGMSNSKVSSIFLSYAGMIGGIGSGVGAIAGLGVCLILKRYPIVLPDSYYLDLLPVNMSPYVFVGFFLMGIIIAVLSAVLPVRQASQDGLVEVLRYE